VNEHTIGEVAGEVWVYLAKHGGQAEVTTIRNQVRAREGVSADLGMGWLAREGKLYFTPDHGTVQVFLR